MTYLEDVQDSTDTMVDDVKAAGTPAIEKGQEIQDDLENGLTEARGSFNEAVEARRRSTPATCERSPRACPVSASRSRPSSKASGGPQEAREQAYDVGELNGVTHEPSCKSIVSQRLEPGSAQSPDGRRIAYTRNRREERRHLHGQRRRHRGAPRDDRPGKPTSSPAKQSAGPRCSPPRRRPDSRPPTYGRGLAAVLPSETTSCGAIARRDAETPNFVVDAAATARVTCAPRRSPPRESRAPTGTRLAVSVLRGIELHHGVTSGREIFVVNADGAGAAADAQQARARPSGPSGTHTIL